MNLRYLFLFCSLVLGILYWFTRSPVREPVLESPPEPSAVIVESQTEPSKSAPTKTTTNKPGLVAEPILFNENQIKEIRGHIQTLMKRSQSAQRGNFDEIERFSTDLFFSGMPTPNFKNILYGFLEPYLVEPSDGEDPRRIDSSFLKSSSQPETFPVPKADFALSSLKQYCQKACTATANTYEVILGVNLDSDPDLDVWTTDETREIRHAHDDLEFTNKAVISPPTSNSTSQEINP